MREKASKCKEFRESDPKTAKKYPKPSLFPKSCTHGNRLGTRQAGMTDLLPLGGLRSASTDPKSHPEFHNGFKLTGIGTCAKKNPPPLPAAPSLPRAGTGSRVLCINELRTSCSELKLIQHTWRKSSFLTQGSRGSTAPTKPNLGKRRTQSCFTNLHQNL